MIRRIALPFPIPVNAWLDGDLLVDCGYPWSLGRVRRALRGHAITRVLLTHAHPDHVGRAAALGVPILAHRRELPFLTGRARLGDEPAWWAARLLHRPLPPWNLGEVEPLDEGDRVGRWTVLHTPGHTPGSLSLWDPEERELMVADTVVNQFGGPRFGVPWFSLDLRERRRSVEKLAELPARRLHFGHGPSWEGDAQALLRRLLARSSS